MKTIEQWFDEYGESHRNPLNKLLHWICVPLITFSLLGILWSVHPYLMIGFMAVAMLFYLTLSWRMTLAMGVVTTLMVLILSQMQAVFWPCLAIFVVAWIGQFVGHGVEGRKPSFFKDVQFLLIGPLWVVAFIFRRLGVHY